MSESKVLDLDTEEYVVTNYIKNLSFRAILYLNNGYPVHLRGLAGVGKTSLAYHIAKKIGRPILLICGNEDISNENLIGGYSGIKKYFLEDNFITTVYKKEEIMRKTWNDGRLLTACKEGYTVIYDEFTRTPSEINNVFLPILEEKIVDVPYGNDNTFIKIHPEFHIIFTSNPEEYIGVYQSPNALIDRMITIDMTDLDEDTEKHIIMSRSGMCAEDSQKIVSFSRYIKDKFKEADYVSIRGSIMLAKMVKADRIKMVSTNIVFRLISKDIFNSINLSLGLSADRKTELNKVIDEAIDTLFINQTNNING